MILCLCLSFASVTTFAGCGRGNNTETSEGGSEGDDGIDDEDYDDEEEDKNGNPLDIAGAKVLTRPDDYDFSAAVGDFSENYYNIFARWINNYLYKTYVQQSLDLGEVDYVYGINDGFSPLVESENGINYSTFDSTGAKNPYLLDSMRYTIGDVAIDDTNQKITIALDSDAEWNWSIADNASDGTTKYYTYFDKLVDDGADTIAKESGTYTISGALYNEFMLEDEHDIVDVIPFITKSALADYKSFYYSEDTGHEPEVEKDTFFYSPYYKETYDSSNVNVYVDFYQDAMEYAVYLIVLGYDYAGADADFFDFTIANELKNGNPTGSQNITVGGWEENPISIVDALGRVKEKYKAEGKYVGVTKTDIDTIADFIVNVVIGQNSPEKFASNGINYHRNYESVVHNIVKYACEQAPIGEDSNGNQIHLADSFLVSRITEYNGNQFFENFDIPAGFPNAGKNDEDNEYLFYYVPAAEYQSVILYPLAKDLNTTDLTDIWLSFEYYVNPTEGSSNEKVMLDSITITVGFRYFDHTTGTFIVDDEKDLTINYGKYTDSWGGDNVFKIGFDENEQDLYEVALPESFRMKTTFNNVAAINPRVDKKNIDEAGNYYMGLDVSNRDYYKLRTEDSGRQHAMLNEDMFKEGNSAGNEPCDFMEVYFDVHKDASEQNACYSFKTCLCAFGSIELD